MVGDQAGRFTYALIQLDDLLVVLLIGRTNPLSLTQCPRPFSPILRSDIYHNLSWSFDPDPTSNILSHSSWKPTPTIRQMQFLGRSLSSISKPVLRRGSSFRNELHDNGASSLNVRIVINYSFFLYCSKCQLMFSE